MGVEADAPTDAPQDFESSNGKKQTEENRNNQTEKKYNNNKELENVLKTNKLTQYVAI